MSRRAAAACIVLLACLLLTACAPTRKQVRIAEAEVARLQSRALDCQRADRCAIDSPLRAAAVAAMAASTDERPRHRVQLLDAGQDALLTQIHLIRAAQSSIDVQSFIFAEDDAGYFVLSELLDAARRGVKVRVLVDQMFSVDDVGLLARLAQAHINFALRLYNPTFGEAHTNKIEFVAGAICCFARFNHRMHNKLLLVDGIIGVTGGRNYQNRYFDWDPEFNYRDRDVIVAGPAAGAMRRSFDRFWQHRLSVPISALHDVARARRNADPDVVDGPVLRPPPLIRADRMLDLSAMADSPTVIEQRLVATMLEVGPVEYLSDLPNKPFQRPPAVRDDVSGRLRGLLRGADHTILLQTPYLVFSTAARVQFTALRRQPQPPRIRVSTNSLAATDAFPVYALSHKYKRRYLREFGFEIHEYKPFPASSPVDPPATGATADVRVAGWAGEARRTAIGSKLRRRGPLPLQQAGPRVGLHAKALVIDREVATIGTHNFDPRSDRLNTESVVIIEDARFAHRLASVIEQDMLPENSWTVAPRPRPPVLAGLNYSLGKLFEQLPLFDFWPWRYATSWEILPGCSPLPPNDPRFRECYRPVGDFPEVQLSTKAIYTRILTAFGAGLRPIL